VKRGKDFKAPFAVLRQIGTSMEDQLVSGFTCVIRSGMYANGTSLPGVRKLAVAFGVSEITIRNAVKRLCRDGLIAARPRVGLTVCAPGSRSWRGSVLGIKAGPPGMYFASVLENSMASVLRRNGWLYTSVEVSPQMDDADVTTLNMMMDASVRFVVLLAASPQVVAYVSKLGIPFIGARSEKVSGETAFAIGSDLSGALSELAQAMRSAGVRNVLSVYQHPSVRNSFADRLENEGMKVRRMFVRPVGGRNVQECIQRAGLQAFNRILSNGGVKEDAVVCNDDYLAAGILSAFDWHGVRMPQDIRFATLSNKGLGPVHMQDLTRIEHDPAQSGARIGEAVLVYLETGKAKPCSIAVMFKRGETI